MLDSYHAQYETRDIKADNPSYVELKEWLALSELPVRRFFNTSGQIYRSSGLKDKLPSISRVLKPGGALYIADPRFPALVRSILNGVFRLIHVAGEFLNPDEIAKRFAGYGFVLDSLTVDGYVQVVKLRKEVEKC